MLNICSHLSWNGEKSVLAQQLTDKYQNQGFTDRLMTYLYSNDFVVKYGEWKGQSTKIPVDEVAKEPTLQWVESTFKMPQVPAVTVYQTQKPIQLSEGNIRIPRTERLSKEALKEKIRSEIIEVARKSPTTEFILNYTDLSSRYTQNSGFTIREYAEIMDEMREEFPANISFPAAFKSAMDNSPARISKNLESLIENQHTRMPVNMDGQVLLEQKSRMSIPIVDDQDATIGFFDELDQETAEESMFDAVYTLLVNSPQEPVVKILHRVLFMFQKVKDVTKVAERKNVFTNVINSFAFPATDERPSFAATALDGLKAMGYNVNKETRGKILDYLSRYKKITEAPNDTATYSGEYTQNIEQAVANNAEEAFEDLYERTFAQDASLGRGAEDWSSVSFEIDQRDTASTRMKLFLSTIKKHEFAFYKPALKKEGAVDLSHIKALNQITKEVARQANGKDVWHDDQYMQWQIVQYLNQEYDILHLQKSLGLYQLVNFDDMFELTLNTLAGQSDQSIENYVRLLSESQNPNLKALAYRLTGKVPGMPATNKDVQLQNEFVKVFSKQYDPFYRDWETDRKSTRLNSSHRSLARMPSSA